MADLVLYGTPLSPFVRKVQVVLGHTGCPYDFETVNIRAMPDWFLEISPARRIPVIRDRTIGTEGQAGTIFDSSAISLFLDRRLNAGLFGTTPFEAGRIAAIEEYADSVLGPTVGMGIFRPILFPRFAGKPSDLDTARKTWSETLPSIFDYLEGVLNGGAHFVGGRYSLADIAVGCQMLQLDLVAGLPDADRWPALVKHSEAMRLRPEFARNLEASFQLIAGILPEKVDLR
ncbi:MAG: glutathione S-transferase family protein [Alphaproteobacteria bacterium]|nr:glutathione S-transferase family protein [Alphaproteobacteria bacterium]